jgi:geranylgeranyl pyrophosphate synthase
MIGTQYAVRTDEALALVEEELQRAMVSDVETLSDASQHIIHAGGKRLRPRVLVLSHQAAGGTGSEEAARLAAAVELLHTASLIHDDINDQSDTRRGQKTVNARWGDTMALLTGDFVFVRLLDLLSAYDSKVIQVFAKACKAIVEGEAMHLLWQGSLEVSEECYLRMVSRKTASLFSACSELGGILADAPAQQVIALRNYGHNLGIAFQIRDDTLDVVGTREELGKPVASDLKQGKVSLATLFALSKAENAAMILSSGNGAEAAQLLRETGALEYAALKATEYGARAQGELLALPESAARRALAELAEFAAVREY